MRWWIMIASRREDMDGRKTHATFGAVKNAVLPRGSAQASGNLMTSNVHTETLFDWFGCDIILLEIHAKIDS